MAEIAPNSEILLLKGIPIDSSYEHTIWFSTETAQYNYFSANEKFTLTNQQYQRADKGSIRVDIVADSLYDVNYCMFRNTAFGDKWFYAFVDDVTYVNNRVSIVSYTIDYIQSYLFDIEFGECWVERETPVSDNLFENVVPENLETGEYVAQRQPSVLNLTEGGQSVAFFYKYEAPPSGTIPQYPIYNAGVYNGIFLGMYYTVLPLDTATLNSFLTQITQQGGTIAGAVQIPTELSRTGKYDGTISSSMPLGFNYNNTSYTPRNNKLYTYPYTYLLMSNNEGSETEYHWEDFAQTSPESGLHWARFNVEGNLVPTPEYAAYPTNYKGIYNAYEYGLTFSDFICPPFSLDSFTSWWSANKNAFLTSTIVMSILAIGATLATGGVAAGTLAHSGAMWSALATRGAIAGGAISGVAGKIGEHKSHKLAPDSISQWGAVPALRLSQNRMGFTLYPMGIKPEMAKVIDDFFTKFGYACHQVKTPSIHNRQYWTYVKTEDCLIHPKNSRGFSSIAESTICSAFNKGITWWTSGNIVGNYSLYNGFLTN